MIRRVCVTGGSGFIGSHFVDKAMMEGCKVRVVDNYRTGRKEFLDQWRNLVEIYPLDITRDDLHSAFDGCDWVVHFAANADVRHGLEHPMYDLEVNTLGTGRVLDAMRIAGVSKIFFASTASIYGNYQADGIREDCPLPQQNSLYGTSKLAGEGLIGAYVEGFDFTGVVGRWVQVIGERYLHGHVIDFVRKLLRDPIKLEILGDGMQRKSGIWAPDLVAGIWTAMNAHDKGGGFHPYNIGTKDTFTVDQSADLISQIMGVEPVPVYTGRLEGGWVGDNPYVLLDSSKIRNLGWQESKTIEESITSTVEWLLSEDCTYL